MKDYYAILGVKRNASEKEIRQAYRRLARELHPDLHPGDKQAEQRFKEVNEAYQVLSNPENRKKYDQYGENWKYADQFAQAGAGNPFGWSGPRITFDVGASPFESIFEEIFSGLGGRSSGFPRFSDYEVSAEVTLEEAFRGTKRIVEVPAAGSTGRSRRIEVRIPPGIEDGSRVRVPIGDAGAGDLYIRVRVIPDARFERKGGDLYTEVSVPIEDLVLGGEVEIQGIDSRAVLTIPAGTQNGRRFRLSGKGMPRIGQGGTRGDLYVTVKARLPENVTAQERELFERLRSLRLARR